MILFLVTVVSALCGVFGAGNTQCGYDCTAPEPNAFGGGNFNGGLGSFPFPDTKAFTPSNYLQICTEDVELTPFLQPQIVPNMFNYEMIVICPGQNKKMLEHVKIDQFSGAIFSLDSVEIDTDSDIISFKVAVGKVVVNAGTEVFVYDVTNLSAAPTKIDGLSASAVGLPAITSVYFLLTLENNNILKVPFASPLAYETIPVTSGNLLGYNLVDGANNIFFTNGSAVMKVSGSVETAIDLSSEGLTCSSILLPEAGKIMIAANGASDSKIFIISTDFATAALSEPLATLTNKISHLNRVAYTLNGLLTIETAAATEIGLEIFRTFPTISSDGFEAFKYYETNAALVNFPGFALNGEPGFSTKKSLIANDVTVFPPSRVYGAKEFPESKFKLSTSPLLFNALAIVTVTTDGTAVVFSYCNRYNIGDDAPEDRPCPFQDVPPKDDIDVVIVVLASAGASIFLPLGIYAYNRVLPHKEEEHDHADEEVDEDDE